MRRTQYNSVIHNVIGAAHDTDMYRVDNVMYYRVILQAAHVVNVSMLCAALITLCITKLYCRRRIFMTSIYQHFVYHLHVAHNLLVCC